MYSMSKPLPYYAGQTTGLVYEDDERECLCGEWALYPGCPEHGHLIDEEPDDDE